MELGKDTTGEELGKALIARTRLYRNVQAWFERFDVVVTPTLSPDFKKISLEHPRSRVLASVPGTSQAVEAVLLAQVPQTARVNKRELKAPDVRYQGEPEFAAIPQTTRRI